MLQRSGDKSNLRSFATDLSRAYVERSLVRTIFYLAALLLCYTSQTIRTCHVHTFTRSYDRLRVTFIRSHDFFRVFFFLLYGTKERSKEKSAASENSGQNLASARGGCKLVPILLRRIGPQTGIRLVLASRGFCLVIFLRPGVGLLRVVCLTDCRELVVVSVL